LDRCIVQLTNPKKQTGDKKTLSPPFSKKYLKLFAKIY
jgi:hypothetical protein